LETIRRSKCYGEKKQGGKPTWTKGKAPHRQNQKEPVKRVSVMSEDLREVGREMARPRERRTSFSNQKKRRPGGVKLEKAYTAEKKRKTWEKRHSGPKNIKTDLEWITGFTAKRKKYAKKQRGEAITHQPPRRPGSTLGGGGKKQHRPQQEGAQHSKGKTPM